MRIFVLLLLGLNGCSAILAARGDDHPEKVKHGISRREVERAIGRPESETPTSFGTRAVYHLSLGDPASLERAGKHVNVHGSILDGGSAGRDFGGLWLIIALPAMAAYEVGATTSELIKGGKAERYEMTVDYDKEGRVVSYTRPLALVPTDRRRWEPSGAEAVTSTDPELTKRWEAVRKRKTGR